MKLEVGLYFRTKDGIIGKIDSMSKDGSEIYFDTKPIFTDSDEFGSKWCHANDILNTNHNIKKLIEVGDIVYIEEADDYACEFFRDIYMIKNEDSLLHIIDLINKPNVRLLSILTKEQFENNCYKAGDN